MQHYQANVPLSMRTDPPRQEERVRIAIEILRTGVHSVCGNPVQGNPGDVVEVVVYRSELDSVKDMVETEFAAIERAEAANLLKQRAHIAKALELSIDEVPEDRSAWDRDMVKAERTFPGSMEAEFCQSFFPPRGIKPFKAVEVVEEGIAPPRDPYAPAPVLVQGSDGSEVQSLKAELAELKQMLRNQSKSSK